MTTVTVDVPANLWVTSNSRLHWRVKARRVRALRRLAHMLVKTRRIPPMGRAHLTVHVHPRRGGRMTALIIALTAPIALALRLLSTVSRAGEVAA